MSSNRQANSDPLPYVQVDRAVKPRAALLAGALGVTTQHALGSLVEWWDLNGDPRELERIVEATAAGDEPAVVVTREDAAMRFRLASGKDVEPIALVHLGLLEPVGDKFRVRGMSRYFAPVEARLRARRAAVVGGKASAASRRKANGTAQPTAGESFGAPFDVRFESASGAVRTVPERLPNGSRSDAEAGPNPNGQRSAVSGQSTTTLVEQAPLLSVPAKPPRLRPMALDDKTLTDDEWAVFDHWRVSTGKLNAMLDPKRLALIRRWLATPGVTVQRLQRAIDGCCRTPWNRGVNPSRKKYLDLELILRDAKQLEQFEGAAA